MAEVANDELSRIADAFGTVFRAGRAARVHERVALRSGLAIDRTEFALLGKIAAERSVRISDLAHRVGMDVSTISRKVHQLEAHDLVTRLESTGDRRASIVTLAPAGSRILARLRREWAAAMGDILVDWPPDDRAELARLLERFADDVTAYGRSAG